MEAVKAMHFAESEQKDILTWPQTKKGNFSAYHFEMQRRKGGIGTSNERAWELTMMFIWQVSQPLGS